MSNKQDFCILIFGKSCPAEPLSISKGERDAVHKWSKFAVIYIIAKTKEIFFFESPRKRSPTPH